MRSATLTKITCPTAHNVVKRRRLFRHLDAARTKPLLWIASPAGSGKTTLLSSYVQERNLPFLWYRCDEGDADPATFFHYMALAARKANPHRKKPLPSLTPEYLAGLPTFTRRYFEDIYSRLTPPCLLVLDDYQSVSAESQFHEMLAQGIDVMPERVTLAILSRHEPPPQFARFGAYDRMTLIGWNDIRFTLEETAAVVNAGLRQRRSREAVLEVHQKADGWVAAIVLMLERARLRGAESDFPGEVVSRRIFDYFANEILSKTAPETRDFLLKTAFLPTISVPVAEQLTGSSNASRILSNLSRQNYFTHHLSGTGQEYQYHPLFRDCLVSRARAEIEPAALSSLLGKAAVVLSEAGRSEEAAALLVEIGDWDRLARLLTDQATAFIAEGRNKTLEGYLRKLPVPILEAAPRLLYWLGICRMPFDVEESRQILEQAFRSFDKARDVPWAFAAWAAVVDSIITEHNDYTKLDAWIEWLDAQDGLPAGLPLGTKRETVAYMLFALTFRRPWHAKTKRWAERAEELIRSSTDLPGTMIVGARLLLHYTFFGEVNKAECLLRNMRPPQTGAIDMRVLSLIQWQVITAGYAALGSGSSTDCLAAVDRGLTLSREHGIHVFEPLLLYLGAVSCVVSGDGATADRFLEEMVALRTGFNEMQVAYYVSVLAWRDLVRGDARSATERITSLLSLTERLGHTINSIANRIGLAHALFELGEKKKARQHLTKARALHGTGSHWLEYMLLATEAYFALREGRDADGLELTRRAMTLSRQRGVTVFVYWRPSMLGLLCTRALAAGIETDHVRGLVRRYRLEPSGLAVELESWPWPLRIYTMGSFQVVRDDVPLEFAGKAPQKPFELLKALIAFGGLNVPEDRLTDALWPDADGDLAHQALDITLRRLRRLLGGESSVRHTARQLSLDPQHCWVDSLALESLLKRPTTSSGKLLPQRYAEAAALYRGHFLPSDSGRDWAVAKAETLKSMLLRLVEETGRHYERCGEWESAGACYEKGLETDNLAEELYRRLMGCYQMLGKRTEALRLYDRCRHELRQQLGIAPSPETEAVHSALLR